MAPSHFCKRILAFPLALCALLAAALLLAGPAEARNVPGSASAVQSRIDRAVANSLIDTTLGTARRAAQFDSCRDMGSDPKDEVQQMPCDWSISFGGGYRYVEGSPNGFDFDFDAAFGSLVIAHAVSPKTTLLAGIITEHGEGDLDFNDGTLENTGVGGVAGLIYRINDSLDVTLLGGAEWLNYEVSRSSGDFDGDYDATRYFADAQLHGISGFGAYFLEYGGGLRFLHQENDGYQEHADGGGSASVPSTDYSLLTAVGDLKFGTTFENITPYLQASAYANLNEDSGFAASFGSLEPGDEDVYGRFGLGADVNLSAGQLSFTTGVFADDDGFQGVDAALRFSKTF